MDGHGNKAPRTSAVTLTLRRHLLYIGKKKKTKRSEAGTPISPAPEVEEIETLQHELEDGGKVLRRRRRDKYVAVAVRDRAREAQPDGRRLASAPEKEKTKKNTDAATHQKASSPTRPDSFDNG